MTHEPDDLATTLLGRARMARERDERRLSAARASAVEVLRSCIREGRIRRAWVVGSAAWGGAHGHSDIDIAVEGFSGDGIGALWDRLSEVARLDVDLLRIEELDPGFRERVIAEGIEIDGS